MREAQGGAEGQSRGETLPRVQVDGVDSSLLKPPAAGAAIPPREFDPKLELSITVH